MKAVISVCGFRYTFVNNGKGSIPGGIQGRTDRFFLSGRKCSQYPGSKVVFRVEVLEALKTNSDLVVKLENGVLKLYDKQGTLLQEISM